MQHPHMASAWSVEKHARVAALLCLSWVAIIAVFYAFPVVDVAISGLFCVRDGNGACNLFPAREHWLTGIFRPLFYWAPVGALILMAGDIALQCMRAGWSNSNRMKGEVLAIAAYLIGPILIVNAWLKTWSGRPRPVDVTLFGGDLSFVRVGDFSGACASNCSFVSGEAAAAGWLLCLIPLVHGRFRNLIVALMIDVSLAAPLLRVAMGAHFMSDALLGWLIGAASMPLLIALLAVLPKGISATLDRVR